MTRCRYCKHPINPMPQAGRPGRKRDYHPPCADDAKRVQKLTRLLVGSVVSATLGPGIAARGSSFDDDGFDGPGGTP